MRKPDDELKINIAELFGGDLPSPSEALEDVSASDTSVSSPIPSKIPPEVENQFQEWMNQRNEEWKPKSFELEKKLQETPLPKNEEPEPREAFSLSRTHKHR